LVLDISLEENGRYLVEGATGTLSKENFCFWSGRVVGGEEGVYAIPPNVNTTFYVSKDVNVLLGVVDLNRLFCSFEEVLAAIFSLG
jgi:hypothetical protein